MINLSVIVPFFNEEIYLEESVNRVLNAAQFSQILLIDNGSTDSSLSIAKDIESKNKNVFVIQSSIQKGKGHALKQAFKLVSNDHFIVHDADLEYFPEDILEMYELSKVNNQSMILGSRFIGHRERDNKYLSTYLANRLISFYFSFLNFYFVTDVATCYKLMPKEFLKKTNFLEDGFAIEIEILSKFLKYNKSIIEHPIRYIGRTYDEGKKIKLSDGFIYLYKIIYYRFLG